MSGESGIIDIIKKAVEEYKNDYKVLTELAMAVNYKSWQHSSNGVADDLGSFYANMFYRLQGKLVGGYDEEGNEFEGILSKEGCEYYWATTD